MTAVAFSATLSGYVATDKNVAVDTAASTSYDFRMVSKSAGVMFRKMVPINGGRPYIAISSGVVTLANFTGTGVVRLLGLDGRLLYRCPFNSAGRTMVMLPLLVRSTEATSIIRVSRSFGSDIVAKVAPIRR
jgi:hypothetical protein